MINKYQAIRNWLKEHNNLIGCYYLDTKAQRHKIRVLIVVEHEYVERTTQDILDSSKWKQPNETIPYEHIILEVSKSEFEKIKKKELLLPLDWKLNYVFKGEKLNKNERGTNRRIIALEEARKKREK